MPGDKLQWLSDETIQDWTQVEPDENLGDKTWKIRNNGTTTWGAGYMLVHDSGDQMGAPDAVPLPPLAPTETGQVTVPALIAPTTEGVHRANWLPHNASGKPFVSNLTIVIDVTTNGHDHPVSGVGVSVAQRLSGYGITFIPDHWSDETAQRVQDVIVNAANRLYEFASTLVPSEVLNNPQGIFRRFFGGHIIRHDPALFKLIDCPDPVGHPEACGKAYAWNSGGELTFFGNAIFDGAQPLKRQSGLARFKVNFTTEFLILHELSHSHGWINEYIESTMPLIPLVEAATGTHFGIETITIASAGFKHGARSLPNMNEYSADALANWFQQSFTGPADGDNEGLGNFRRTQMDEMIRRWVVSKYGPIHR
jgi:hypothetical protein